MNILSAFRTSFETVRQNKKSFILLAILQTILLGGLYFLNKQPQISFEELELLSVPQWLTSISIFLLHHVASPLFIALPLIFTVFIKNRTISTIKISARVALYYCMTGILFELYFIIFSWSVTQIQNTPQLLMLLGPILLILTFLGIPIWVVCRSFGIFYLSSGQKINPTFQTILSSFKSHPFKKLFQMIIINLACNFPAAIFDFFVLQPVRKNFNIYSYLISFLLQSFGYLFMTLCFYTIWKDEWEN